MLAALPPPPPAIVHIAPAVPSSGSHEVRAGETIGHIALDHGVSEDQLRRVNGIGSDSVIRVGQKLRIPSISGRSGSARASRSSMTEGLSAERRRTHDVVAETARKYGVSPSLALAVAWQESRWTNNALSDKGAIGAMQCMPLTGDYMGRLAGRPLNLWNVRDNATCGVLLLKSLDKETGSEAAKLAAYYQGLDSLRKYGMYEESRLYVQSVKKHRETIRSGQRPRS